MTINNKSERNYRGKCLGSPVTSYGGAVARDNNTILAFKPGDQTLLRLTQLIIVVTFAFAQLFCESNKLKYSRRVSALGIPFVERAEWADRRQ